jgi:hypothetical protein
LGHYRDFLTEFIDETVNIVDVNLTGFRGNKRGYADEGGNKKDSNAVLKEENVPAWK